MGLAGSARRTTQSVELRSLDRHSDPAITSLISDAVAPAGRMRRYPS